MSGILVEDGRAQRVAQTAPAQYPLSYGQWFRVEAYSSTGFTELVSGTLTAGFATIAATISNATNEINLQTPSGSSPSGFVPALNTYYYLGVSIDNLDQRLYIWNEAGALVGSTTRTDDISAVAAINALQVLGLGNDDVVGWQARMWDAVLSSAEFIAERNSPTIVRTADEWGWWQYLSGAVLDDSGPDGRDLVDSYNYSEWGGAEPVLPSGDTTNAIFFGTNF